ncbi:translation initiation factor IF-2 [Longimicrobium sp.]|uniref:translation initiation factor IF-2 n=1 Tax=Longimicrobium sp. TaxID=2029185 RepID=UPI002C3D7B88|nr:translation initiation factor IF-2 [Longimicrobium sp.]HSU13446.1 translation initiation factor IF-2 [Longimicrobium sp.]
MRVFEVAKELSVPAEALVHLLREMDIPVRSHMSEITDEHAARVRTRIEREIRLGHRDVGEAVEAAIGEVASAPRRRRRKAEAGAEGDSTASPTADAAEALEAEAAGAAAERGAELVTTGGHEPTGGTVIVDTSEPPADLEPVAEAAPAAPAAEEAAPEPAAAPEPVAAEPEAPAPVAEAHPEPARPEPARPEPPRAGPISARPDGGRQLRPEFKRPERRGEDFRPAASATPGAPPRDRGPTPPPSVRPARPGAPGEPRREGSGGGEPPRPARTGEPPRPARADGFPARSFGPPAPARAGFPAAGGQGGAPRPAGGQGQGGGQRPAAGAGASAGGAGRKDKKKGKKGKGWVDQEAVDQTFRKTMAAMESGGRKKRRGPQRDMGAIREERAQAERARRAEEASTVRVNEFLTVAELAELIDVPATQIIGSAFKNLGLMVTINQRLDFDQIELLLDEFGFKAVREEEYGGETEEELEPDAEEDLRPRPPVVTVMGHVDHGKTSLLDYIRKTNVIAGEAGGITQHIGAYHVALPDGRAISFLDTPGHAAFTAMRARGAEVTDVVILVVAADDSVMPQTVEAISHARNAGVPLVVAVNKVDLPDANPMRVKQDLLQHGVVLEDFGGDVQSAEVSAKKGDGIDDLLEKVLLQAEFRGLRANPAREAVGTVIEAQLDVGKGPVATVLVTNGTLHVGDHVVVGLQHGRVRAMLDERGRPVKAAGPAIPVQILGLSGVPGAGDQMLVMDAERATDVAQTRQRLDREKRMRLRSGGVKLTDIGKLLARGDNATLNLVIKGDVDGSVQALSDSLEQLSTNEVRVQVIHRGVGAINESDVLLASTSNAIVVGFHVRPTGEARAVAEREDVDIRLYNIIYEAVEEVKSAMEGLLAPEQREVLLGTAQVRQLFKVPRVGTVAGCMVTSGVLDRRGRIRVIRDAVQVYEGELESLKRFKDDAREVREGFECGLNIRNFNDVKVGDVLECYRVEEVARTLAGAAADAEREGR